MYLPKNCFLFSSYLPWQNRTPHLTMQLPTALNLYVNFLAKAVSYFRYKSFLPKKYLNGTPFWPCARLHIITAWNAHVWYGDVSCYMLLQQTFRPLYLIYKIFSWFVIFTNIQRHFRIFLVAIYPSRGFFFEAINNYPLYTAL